MRKVHVVFAVDNAEGTRNLRGIFTDPDLARQCSASVDALPFQSAAVEVWELDTWSEEDS